MKLKQDKFIELLNSYYEGNCVAFAYRIGINPAQLNLFVNTGTGAGRIMIGGVMHFCKEKGLNYWDYIDLDA